MWQKRVDDAEEARHLIEAVVAEMRRGFSRNDAIDRVLPSSKRSWATRRLLRYRAIGFEGLFDTRLPREPDASRRVARNIAEEERRHGRAGVAVSVGETGRDGDASIELERGAEGSVAGSVEEVKAADEVQSWANANRLDGFSFSMEGRPRDAVVDRFEKNERSGLPLGI